MDELFLLDVRKAGFRAFLVNLLLNSFMLSGLRPLWECAGRRSDIWKKDNIIRPLKLAMDIAGVFGVKVKDLFEFTDE